MKKLLNGLLFLVISNTIYAQHTIKGSITDIDTDTPLIFANIYLPNLEKGTVSDENGIFKITNIPKGTHKITYSIMGYETIATTIDVPLSKDLNIALYTSVIEMEAVILSTPFHKLQSDNVMKVEQITIKDLNANGSATLSEGITAIAGVESVSTGLSIGKPVIRGLSSNRVLVYTQGIRLENQQFGDEHGLGVNATGIESVEVIKGPASLLYGSDALGGVLYLNPEKFAKQNTSAGDVNYKYFTNTQGQSTHAGFKSSSDTFKFIFRGSIAEHADYKTKHNRVTNTRFKEQDFKAAIGYHSTAFKTAFRYNVNASQLGIPEGIEEQSTSKTPLLPNQNLTNHIFSSKSTLFLDASSLEFNFGYTYNHRKEFEEEHLDEHIINTSHNLDAALRMKLKTYNYDVKYNLPKLGKFETIVGIQGMHQTNINFGEEQLIPDATTNDFGALATSHIHFETVDLQLGARFDHRFIDVNEGINKNFNSFNTAIGIKTYLFTNIVSRINIASGFRAPNLAELTSYGTHEGTNRFEIGNKNLSNEQNLQFDLALEFKNEHVEIFANGFYNTINNYIFLSPNGDIMESTPVYLYLQSKANLYGGEFGIHIHPHPIDWLHLESSFETVTGKQDNGEYLPLIPAKKLSNTLRIKFENKWLKNAYSFTTLSHTFKQNNINTFETSTGNYTLLSAGFGGEFLVFNKVLNISVSGNNLLDTMYINHLSRLKADKISNMGRNITIGMSYLL